MHKAYEISVKQVAQALGIKLKELDDWNCCGATSYMAVHEMKSFAFSARNLALAEKEGKDILAICAACYNVLNKTNNYFNSMPTMKDKIVNALAAANLSYHGSVKVRHFVDILLNDVGEEFIRAKIKMPLKDLKVAPYYGCLINRPKGMFDDPESPESMDHILSWAGATMVSFPVKAVCCGGSVSTVSDEIGYRLRKNIILNAKLNGAEVVAVACPFCHLNLDFYQEDIWKRFDPNLKMPIVYFTQLLGLALGISPSQLDLGKESVSVKPVLAKIGRS
jgi:heterodisulfide reductase subunit B